MANSKDFPQPNPKIDYQMTYTQGSAVKCRAEVKLGFMDGAVIAMSKYGRRLGAWFHDDAFGVIDTGVTLEPKDLI